MFDKKQIIKDWNKEMKAKAKKKKKLKVKKSFPKISRKATYKQFLKSKYWKQVRELVLKRDNYKCCLCGSDINLQVHHGTYKNHFKEHRNLSDLITLCELCHKKEHRLK